MTHKGVQVYQVEEVSYRIHRIKFYDISESSEGFVKAQVRSTLEFLIQ